MSNPIPSPRDNDMLYNYLTGGAALGVAGGSLITLLNHLRTMRDNTQQDADDNRLKIYVKKPGQTKLADTNSALAITLAALATAGTYGAVQRTYQRRKQQDLRTQLDQAQRSFVDLSSENAKTARRQLPSEALAAKSIKDYGTDDSKVPSHVKDKIEAAMRREEAAGLEGAIYPKHAKSADAWDYITGANAPAPATGAIDKAFSPGPAARMTGAQMAGAVIPISAATLLLASTLASGRLLNHYFPDIKRPSTLGPRRLQLMYAKDGSPDQDDAKNAEIEKSASVDDDELGEFITRLVYADGRNPGVTNCVKLAAAGRMEELRAWAKTSPVEAMDKAAACKDLPTPESPDFDLAIGWCQRDPLLGPLFKQSCALEVFDNYPLAFCAADKLASAEKLVLVKLAEYLAADTRKMACAYLADDAPAVKIAAMMPRQLGKMIGKGKPKPKNNLSENPSQGDGTGETKDMVDEMLAG